MRTVGVLVVLLAVGVGVAGEPAPIPGDALWDYGAWADDYLVTSTSYDAATGKVIWELEARRKVTARRYQARFTDPDLIELTAKEITLTPAVKEHAKGARVKAVMKLPPREVLRETNRVTVGGLP